MSVYDLITALALKPFLWLCPGSMVPRCYGVAALKRRSTAYFLIIHQVVTAYAMTAMRRAVDLLPL